MNIALYILSAIGVMAIMASLFNKPPTAEQLQNRANSVLYKEMRAFRNYLVQTGTAQQLDEFDLMFNRVKDLIDERVQKVIDKGYI